MGCFAHIRRKFVDAWETAGKQGIAKEVIDIIAKLYRLESDYREKLKLGELSSEQFVDERARALKPIFEELRNWLMTRSYEVAPKSKLGMAIAYAQELFDRAIRFVQHPLLTPDTNRIENPICPFVVGRKNWLFSGSPRGVHANAGLYSIIETAKANGHEPFAYLCYLFDTLSTCTTEAEREALLPYRLNPASYIIYGV